MAKATEQRASEFFWARGATSPPAAKAIPAATWLLGLLGVSVVGGAISLIAGWPWQWLVVVWILGPLIVWRVIARGRFVDLGLRAPRDGIRTLLIGVAAVVAVNLAWMVLTLGAGWQVAVAADLNTPELMSRLLAAVLAGVLLAGVGEELAYRGAVLRLTAAWQGPVFAIAVSAVLFAILHTPNLVEGQDLSGIDLGTRLLTLLLWGAGVGYAAWRTGGLWLPIAWHAGSNFANEALSAWWVLEPNASAWWVGSQTGIPNAGILGIVLTIAEVAVLCWLAIWLSSRWCPRQDSNLRHAA